MVTTKQTKLKERYTLIWAVMATVGSALLLIYVFNIKHQQNDYMKKGRQIMTNCIESMEVSNKLVKNCSTAYLTTKECMLHLDRCNLNKESEKLKILNDEKITLQREFKKLNIKSILLLEY